FTDSVVAGNLLPWWANLVGASPTPPAEGVPSPAILAYNWLRYGIEATLVLAIFFLGWTKRKRKPATAVEPS
ncbi:MAG: hypothetical protein ABIZ49_06185, partial [Opitutaceae bacterium]